MQVLLAATLDFQQSGHIIPQLRIFSIHYHMKDERSIKIHVTKYVLTLNHRNCNGEYIHRNCSCRKNMLRLGKVPQNPA